MMVRQLDDVERELWEQTLLVGDAAVDADVAVPVQRLTPRTSGTGTGPCAAGDIPDSVDLNGTWLLRGCAPAAQFSIKHWIAGGHAPGPEPVDWWREHTDRSEWTRVTVPGTVQGQLVAAGELPDPLLGSATYDELTRYGEPAQRPWHFRRTRVEQQEWWYARRFSVPAAWRDRRIRLVFDGIDYAATVYLNGAPLRRHTGMFGGPDIEVTGALRFGTDDSDTDIPGTDNEIVVRIAPPPDDWHGVFKPSPGWGWHYGHLISIGLWRSVRLEVIPDLELRHPFVAVTELDIGDRNARVRIGFDLEAAPRPGAEHRARATADVSAAIIGPSGETVASCAVTAPIRTGTNRYETELDLAGVAVWWPFGFGDQPLYRLRLVTHGHSVETSFGVRTITMDTVPDWTGEEHYRWRFVVNGQAMFVKGANWCWTDPMARRGPEIDEHLLDLAVHGNVQMLRVWGGGPIESDSFYEACDRRGILVYQEMPLCFGLPDATGTDLAVLDDQVTRVVRRLRNHPSLVMWGGGNENPRPVGGDDPLLLVGKRVTTLDDTRVFHRSSPWGGSAHNYRVYHEGMPIDEGYRDVDAVLYGEFGLSSQCNWESMRRFIDSSTLEQWPPSTDGAVLQHQAQFSLIDLVKQLRYADYGPVTSWRQMIEYSQIAQGEALRFAGEMLRARSGTHTAGYWYYKFGDVFPGASWAVVDYYGAPKRSYYLARRFSAAVSAFVTTDRLVVPAGTDLTLRAHVANDTTDRLENVNLLVRLWDGGLNVVAEQEGAVDVPAGERATPFDLNYHVPDDGVLLAEVRLTSAERHVLSSQWYWFNAHAKPAAVRALEARPVDELWDEPAAPLLDAYAAERPAPLLELPRTTLDARLEPVVHDTDATLVVTNTGPVPAPLVLIDGFPHGPDRLLHDDAFGLLPRETRTVPVRAPIEELMRLNVRAWNADATPVRCHH